MKSTINELSLLITDDSTTQREYARDLCQSLGVTQLHDAANGVDALSVLQEHPVDIVMVDLEMPVMDGVELIRSIAQKKYASSVIILSAKDPILIASVGTMAEADGLHVLGTFQKPLLPDVLECSLLRFIQDNKPENRNLQVAAEQEVTAVELSHAITNHEITLAFQPKLTVQGLLLRGVEALARWKHPTKGIISPGIFIPLAERHGLIDALTRYLLQKAFEHKRRWQQYGLRFHLAFNLSPLSLADADMVDWLLKMTQDFGVAPADVTFEITENALLGELASAIRTLARLRLKGFHIAIDDYGTGFANAQQLSRVPATELKIDRSLVHRVASRPQQYTILASTVTLAKNLNLTTVAEGVETEEDFLVLQELGVDLVQGYYFSKPLFADDLLAWVKTGISEMRRRYNKH
ncbi:EAL domain-containing response regulator [Cellvibrio japonicus]|uniref:Response regulator n=1 Tax=Cellvibrio japonicus (strain Ueda107) TaxID=498211 RepID=B3PCN0_CELJU|nr:EAL domain-containing response regulator [Cellvibrio japonicus]ACE85747.1 response regulator [Cellvibrio japonicus Ueda107]QEI13253.1 EAL domain-containing response regulator [Cellvibrio japonicus]QEI16827.1 EAL domain-containing response regulator [Cellvibrio japonicus]QEI20405.1 EAL domain-containing response regulator [Cellvibrio japonicus]